MGVTQTFCYCASPFGRCKTKTGGGLEHFDDAHWSEVKTNLEAYLRDDVCVPYANQVISVDAELEKNLYAYVETIAEMRKTDPANMETGAFLLTNLQRSSAFILSYGLGIIDNTYTPSTGTAGIKVFDDIAAENQYVETAKVLAAATRRAAHELRESVKLNNPLYTLHHQALVYDLAQEMTRLAAESSVVETEKLLEAQHPHHQLLEEKWQRDGI